VTRSRRRGAAAERLAAASEEEAPTSTRRRGRGAAARSAGNEEVAAAEEAPTSPRRGGRAGKKLAEEVASDTKKPTSKQAAAKAKLDTKALADRKGGVEEKKTARAEPERYWIQVAGGATEGDLKKAWASTRAKSSLLAGRAGYATPLRATNRVVTGPFKTQAEAQAMVNKLSKQGVSAFTFTSTAGQKMTKLDGK
jgi:cell division protein FtsN